MRVDMWRSNFDATKAFRQHLKTKHGIKVSAEIHATRFIRDRSDGISSKYLDHAARRAIFEEVLQHIATLKVQVFNICLSVPKWGPKKVHLIAHERLANRIQATMGHWTRRSYAVIVFDQGKEKDITRLARKITVFNPIPSAYGTWTGGGATKNIVTDRILEDPLFKDSRSSYFLQHADCAAFTLLKQETPVSPFIAKMGYEKLFPSLHAVCFKAASKYDPWGIVRD
jgi:hypothetical protein